MNFAQNCKENVLHLLLSAEKRNCFLDRRKGKICADFLLSLVKTDKMDINTGG